MGDVLVQMTQPQAPVAINFPGGPGGGGTPTRNETSGTTYTFQLTDGVSKGTFVYNVQTSPAVWTIATQENVAFPVGEGIFCVNGSAAGTLTIQLDTSGTPADSMVTDGTRATTSITLAAATSCYLLHVDTHEWRAYPGV